MESKKYADLNRGIAMKDMKSAYTRRKKAYAALEKKQQRTADVISNLRLGAFLLGLAAISTALATGLFILFGTLAAAFAAVFLWLVIFHDKLILNKKHTGNLVRINEEAIMRQSGDWTGFTDDGSEFADEDHPFSGDLDIFGKGSLFQWTTCAKTFLGRRSLAKLLSDNTGSIEEIEGRQDAADELAPKTAWRQRLIAEGMALPKAEDPGSLFQWAGEHETFYTRPGIMLVIRILPVFTAALAVLSFVFRLIPWYVPAAGWVVQYSLLKAGSRKNALLFGIARKHGAGIKTYSRMLKLFERKKFESGSLSMIKARMTDSGGLSAYRQVERLGAVIDSISNRSTPFYFLLNVAALWDYQNLIALERWKKQSGIHLRDWLEALGETEVLCSLALIRHDHPDWAKPSIIDGLNGYDAKNLGHPLINDSKRVVNDILINSPVKIFLVTGSNMSGKSTYLRTAGINLVLAYAGAPVCAASFRVPLLEIFTCMRIGDNLEKNISSFYAELVRIKGIVEAVGKGKRVFFLLDEIFKGTNSIDRHAGASVLISKLSATDSLGMVSTHDLELCTLAKDDPGLVNCHFREYYDSDGIHFDYKLQPGASTTRNAAFLMKLAGIDTQSTVT